MMEITTRPAVRNDVAAILGIVNAAIIGTTAIYDELPRDLDTQLSWFDQRTAEGFPVIVAESGGRIAGFASFGTFKPKTGYRFTAEHSLYISEDFRGKGIGSIMMKELIALARAKNLRNLVGVIDASNQESVRFHEKFGFETCGTIRQAGFKFGRWLDVTYMQLLL